MARKLLIEKYLKNTEKKMEEFTTNEIPQLLESRKITMKEAVNGLWADIYAHPEKYNLKDLDEDDLSDFLLTYRTRFPSITKKYDKNKADFTTFIRSCMMQFKTCWSKKKAKAKAAAASLESVLKKNAESALVSDCAADPIAGGTEFDDFLLEFEQEDKAEAEEGRTEDEKKKEAKEARETALVLALKACRFMDDPMVSKLSRLTQREESELHTIIDKLKNSMEKKEKIQRLMIRRRDKSFFNKRKLTIELSNLEETCGEYSKLKNLYENQLRSWKRNNEALSHRYVMSPKNSEIAKIMGISIRKVYYCISHAKDEEKMKIFRKVYKENVEGANEE